MTAIKAKDDPEKVDLNSFSDIVDLYVYYPLKESIKNQQFSPDMHYILSANTKSKATFESAVIPKGQEKLHRLLEFVWVRLQERFKNLSQAFRFFDLNFNNRVSFNEFQYGMENLKAKLSSRDQ